MGNRDLQISGAGSYPGGEFDTVSISGAGKINGDLKCIRFSGSGSAKVHGNVICEKFGCSGAGKVTGDVEAKEVRVSGACKIGGDMRGGLLVSSGAATIDGDIKCEQITASGVLTTGKNIEAEEVNIEGAIKNYGTINAEKIRIECRAGNGSCTFNEMGASKISINGYNEGSRPYFFKLFGMFTGGTSVITGNVAEGDDIYMENADVKMVRGDRVVIGPGCKVQQVEYRESIEISDKAEVIEVIKN